MYYGTSPLEVWQNAVYLSPAGVPWSPTGFGGLSDVIGREHAGVSYQMEKGGSKTWLRESESKTYELTFFILSLSGTVSMKLSYDLYSLTVLYPGMQTLIKYFSSV